MISHPRHWLSSRYRQFAMVAGVPLLATAFVLWARGKSTTTITTTTTATTKVEGDSGVGGAPASSVAAGSHARTKSTAADRYFARHNEIPRPPVMHTTLPDLVQVQQNKQDAKEGSDQKKNIFVVGDVHGCHDELLELHEKAMKENDGMPFEYVLMVGDLVNKGPKSAQVVRHVRTTPGFYSVRGNHDDGALAAALGDETRRKKKKYQWVMDGEDLDSEEQKEVTTLSDEDVTWMSELPYTITIPGSMLGEKEEDTLIVHAGIIPDVELEEQEIENMITMRDLLPICDDAGKLVKFQALEKAKKPAMVVEKIEDIPCGVPVTWASVYGPSKKRVIFGHNAKRGLQQYSGSWATGLDTGAVYGRRMTGMILPGRKLVSIQTKEHSPAGK